jgi:3-oxoacyl-[acyl-carrier protein] reductase
MSRGSSIIFLSTSLNVASTVTPGYLTYCASKGAIEQIVRVLSKDLFAKGINVNAIAPGPTATALFLHGKNEQLLQRLKGMSPAGRLGEVEDIAGSIAFLANTSSNGSRWVTGQILRVNGGMV